MGVAHRFGGDWTEQKLEVLAGYLQGYRTALKGQGFDLTYIDAFAGSGSRTTREEDDPEALTLPDLQDTSAQVFFDGSVRRALRIDPPFDHYLFIERSAARCGELRTLSGEFPALADRIEVKQADANEAIRQLCRENWANRRAVLFLDPYGMQVDWATVVAVAGSKRIDLWLLFPVGAAIRMLTKSGDMPAEWSRRLDLFFGTEEWRSALYKRVPRRGLFDEWDDFERATTEVVGEFFVKRLQEIFPGVGKPGVMKNSKNSPLYMLCFAMSNPSPKAIGLGLKMANFLVRKHF